MTDDLSLFDINAEIGDCCYEEPDYPTIGSLVAHLDYLGIDRTLVSFNGMSDWGNPKILQLIGESRFQDRLIPALTLKPDCYYQPGTLEFLREHLASGRVRAFRIFPERGQTFAIRQLERVLGEIAQWKPVLVWNCRNGSEENFRGTCELAKTFPDVSFVLTGRAFHGYCSVVDAMWRNPNVYADISLAYRREAINVLIRHFGANRVLFGTGFKAHYGAAIGALAHYPVTPEEREQIAHGNIERLLGIPPLKKKLASPPELLSKKPLWQQFRNGQPVTGVRILDAHVHLGLCRYRREASLQDQLKLDVEEMDRLGIEKGYASGYEALFGNPLEGNLELERDTAAHRERFGLYVTYHPRYAAQLDPQLDNLFQRGSFIGFKLLSAYWKIPLADPGYEPVWRYADRYHLPILIHTWEGAYNTPAMLKDIVKRYPNALFLLGHSGGGTSGRLEAEALALENPNVFLEFCGSFTTPRPFELSMQLVGKDRIIFGTDTDGHDAAWELGRYLSLPVPDDDLIPGLGQNFEGLLARSTFPQNPEP